MVLTIDLFSSVGGANFIVIWTITWKSDAPVFWLIFKCLTEVALCVLYNYIWGKKFPKNSFAFKTYITTVEICFIWWIWFFTNFLGTIYFIQEATLFFHGPITITSTCLSHFRLSVSGIASVFPFRVIKRQVLQCSLIFWSRTAASYKANWFSRDVNRLQPQSDW